MQCLDYHFWKKEGWPPTIIVGVPATSDRDTRHYTMIIPAVMMAKEVEELEEENPSYEDLLINYPQDLMTFLLEFEIICQH